MILKISEKMAQQDNLTTFNNTRSIYYDGVEQNAVPLMKEYMNSQLSLQEELHNDLYHLPFLTKILVFVFMFSFIALPSMITFIVCYTRDRKYQKEYKLKAKLESEERPDPALPYNALLYRPVPSSKNNSVAPQTKLGLGANDDELNNKQRKVSFARNIIVTSSTSSLKSAPSANSDELEDDVFAEESKNYENVVEEILENKNSGKLITRRHSDYGITIDKDTNLPGQIPDGGKHNDVINNNNNNSTTTSNNDLRTAEIPLIKVSYADDVV